MNLRNRLTFLFFFSFSVAFFLLQPGSLKAQVTAKFEHISLEDGLSQLNDITIIQDRNDFMWYGTRDGLNRYDGHSFKVYKNDPKNPSKLKQ